MMNVTIDFTGVKNGYSIGNYRMLAYETDKFLETYEDKIELIDAIFKDEKLMNSLKENYKDAEKFIILEVTPTHMFLEQNWDDKYADLHKASKEAWLEKANSEEFVKRRALLDLKRILDIVKESDKAIEKLNLKDTQEYLNYLDELNKISVLH